MTLIPSSSAPSAALDEFAAARTSWRPVGVAATSLVGLALIVWQRARFA